MDPRRTALLVVDMQKGILSKTGSAHLMQTQKIIPGLRKIIELCRKQGVLIIFSRHSNEFANQVYRELRPYFFNQDGSPMVSKKSEFFQIIDDLGANPDDIFIDKDRSSPFYQTHLETILRSRKIENVVIAGVATNVCCEAAARDAYYRDFRVYMIEDCCTALSEEFHTVSLKTIKEYFGFTISSKEFSDEISKP